MRRSYLLLLPAFTLSILIVAMHGCLSPAPDFWEEAKPGQKKVLVTFPPLYCITHAIAGDDAYVLCMLTAQGPHDYDAAPTDPLKAAGADLVISNGLGLDDSFVEKMLIATRKDVKTLSIGRVLEETEHDLLLKDKGHLANGQLHIHGTHDPHIWLGPRQAIAMTKIIADKLAEIDPAHKDAYASRADKFIAELIEIEKHGSAKFKDKKHKNIVTMHESFSYFARAFDLTVVSPIQAKPGADPDAASMARLVDLCVKKEVPVIAVEPQYSKAQAETLRNAVNQRKAGIAIIELDPLETAPRVSRYNPDPGYYLAKMRENIDTLARALP